MQPLEWVAVRVAVAPDAADAVGSFLLDAGAAGLVTDEAGGHTVLEGHLLRPDAARVVQALESYLVALREIHPGWAGGIVGVSDVPAVDWEEIFRTHHRARAVGTRLVVAPPWDAATETGRELIVVEPGMAFGTGQHATTRACLEEIEAAVSDATVRSALDVGTGSGVLAAALARLGVARVVALDVDAAVLPLARATFARNAAGHVLLLGGTVAAIRATFDLVVANLFAETLVAEAAGLAAAVAAGGRLVVSGILDVQVPRVLAAFPAWRAAEERGEARWRTLRLVRARA